ncbi:MAG: hypothetical protein ABFR05_00085 [Bacteroidota bacterium]
MKKFEVYKNIRKQALIMGLPISLFALMMLAVIGSLLFIIFSFSLYGIMAVLLLNALLFVVLIQLTNNPTLLHLKKVFPKSISNKKSSLLNYEED